MSAGMDKFSLELTSDLRVVDLILAETFRCLINCMDEVHLSVVGVMLVQTILAYG